MKLPLCPLTAARIVDKHLQVTRIASPLLGGTSFGVRASIEDNAVVRVTLSSQCHAEHLLTVLFISVAHGHTFVTQKEIRRTSVFR
jgi:hypothetical protein